MSAAGKAMALLIKGAITELSTEDQAKVYAVHADLKAKVEEAGDAGLLALALLGAELEED